MKWLLMFLLMINTALAFETHGIGRIAEVTEAGKKKYFLLIKDQDQVGIIPVKINEKVDAKKLSDLKEKLIVFNGKILSEKTFEGELEQFTDVIALSSLREFNLKDISMDKINIDRVEQKIEMTQNPGQAKKATIRLDDRVTQAALFTGTGLMVADAAYMNSSGDDTRKDISKLLVISAGLVMLAEKIKQRYKIDWGNWNIPMNQSAPKESTPNKTKQ
jgi:hypothetical protein